MIGKMALAASLSLVLVVQVALSGVAYLINFDGILAIILIVFEFTCFALKIFFVCSFSSIGDSDDSFVDYFHAGLWQKRTGILTAFVSYIACINLVSYLRYFRTFKTMMMPYVHAVYEILLYFFYFSVWMIVNVVIMSSLMGPRDHDFKDFLNGLTSIMLISTGNARSIYDTNSLFEWLVLFFVVVSMSIVASSIFIVIISNTTRKLALYQGLTPSVAEIWDKESFLSSFKCFKDACSHCLSKKKKRKSQTE